MAQFFFLPCAAIASRYAVNSARLVRASTWSFQLKKPIPRAAMVATPITLVAVVPLLVWRISSVSFYSASEKLRYSLMISSQPAASISFMSSGVTIAHEAAGHRERVAHKGKHTRLARKLCMVVAVIGLSAIRSVWKYLRRRHPSQTGGAPQRMPHAVLGAGGAGRLLDSTAPGPTGWTGKRLAASALQHCTNLPPQAT